MEAVTLDADAGLKWTDESEEGWVSKELWLVLLEEKGFCRKK